MDGWYEVPSARFYPLLVKCLILGIKYDSRVMSTNDQKAPEIGFYRLESDLWSTDGDVWMC